jgi:hypothetical protein
VSGTLSDPETPSLDSRHVKIAKSQLPDSLSFYLRKNVIFDDAL